MVKTAGCTLKQYWWGVPWHIKGGGGLRCGQNPEMGVLGAGTTP